MPVDRKVAETYLKTFLERLRENPQSLSKPQRRIGEKYLKALEMGRSTSEDAKKLNEQVTQANARIRSLELQNQESLGRAEAFLDTIITLHFDDDVADTEWTPPTPVESDPEAAAAALAKEAEIERLPTYDPENPPRNADGSVIGPDPAHPNHSELLEAGTEAQRKHLVKSVSASVPAPSTTA